LDPEKGPQFLQTLLLLLFLGLLLSAFQSTKTFPFHNRSSLNFAHTLVQQQPAAAKLLLPAAATVPARAAPQRGCVGRHLANINEMRVFGSTTAMRCCFCCIRNESNIGASCFCACFLFLLLNSLQKTTGSVVSNRIAMKFGTIILHINKHRITQC